MIVQDFPRAVGLTGNRNLNADAKRVTKKRAHTTVFASCDRKAEQLQEHPDREEYHARYRRSIEKRCGNSGFLQFLDDKEG